MFSKIMTVMNYLETTQFYSVNLKIFGPKKFR